MNTFEDILSEMARSLPKLDRQRTSVTEGEPQWTGRACMGYSGGGRSDSKDFLLIPRHPGTDRRMPLQTHRSTPELIVIPRAITDCHWLWAFVNGQHSLIIYSQFVQLQLPKGDLYY